MQERQFHHFRLLLFFLFFYTFQFNYLPTCNKKTTSIVLFFNFLSLTMNNKTFFICLCASDAETQTNSPANVQQ